MVIRDRLSLLREKMKETGIDCYVIPTSDAHHSEYVSAFFMVRQYFSGFTGSAGTLVVTEKEASLFTDGRYFIQARNELTGSGIQLMKMGEPSVPTLLEYVEEQLKTGQSTPYTIGFDGKVMTSSQGLLFEQLAQKYRASVCWKYDLAADVWTERPKLVHHPVFLVPEEYSGASVEQKLGRVRSYMEKVGAGVHILTSLDDIAWLFNIRGNDVECSPVVLAYAILTQSRALLFAREGFQNGVSLEQAELLGYEDFYSYVGEFCRQEGKNVLLDKEQVNYRVWKELETQSKKGEWKLLERQNPTTAMKAVKNEVELSHIRKAHLKDGIAVTRFMYWLKKNIGRVEMDEVSAAHYLNRLRAGQEGFLERSFPTISAYGEHGAIIHYEAKEGSCAGLKPEGMLMVDSGGHYLDGTTDITRTFVLGKVTEQMKFHYTLVLRAMLNLRATRFRYGCSGANLDIRAREVLWEHGLDYKHGTGHGIGNLLNVHEGPQSFRWKMLPGEAAQVPFEEGMITSDEPGIYLENQYGIRIENELLCRKGEKNEYGQFMYFEDLTFVPIDLDGVEERAMSEVDKERLNQYHVLVFEKLSPYFQGEELCWLKHATRRI